MILIIDHNDSFTYNLYQYFLELQEEVQVVSATSFSLEVFQQLAPEMVVLSPGPGSPEDFPVSLALLGKIQVPILGICLGHQIIGHFFGAKVVPANVPVHGKTSVISHTGEGLFADLEPAFQVTRYHSLVIDPTTVPVNLKVTAVTEDGVIMGLVHATKPIHSVQFHPEAILSENGHAILKNFVRLGRNVK
ncbi:aminodeoxychorismate/anthranilate synthase component II [Listeria monocytogenes]|nr:aminodeoxychorismate/anthranilate synthase component II [Listeria monocytogenes]EHC6164793.1 aminodeoxychorismate/anthranilate synthase component II [Listeria monocytogenes serotype 1/2b]EAG2100051.1 aminodeoxychorismate/anthranilate synthase component II [Listeria monocytogenes]EFP0913970.1 aminodeoxychorismate/anthranilate synthase component II [Listeria monocytogenes]EHD1386777.1 aminodeoxychorismate/anthranilate synthase component II [Listeria monocytogenes]